jgi:hypothetical protein
MTQQSLHLQASHQFKAKMGTYHALLINLITPRTKVLTFHQIQCRFKNGFRKLGSCFRGESKLTRRRLMGISRPWGFLKTGYQFGVGFSDGSCMAWSIDLEDYIDSTLLISSFSDFVDRRACLACVSDDLLDIGFTVFLGWTVGSVLCQFRVRS